MGAIFGFSGPENPKRLAAQRATLKHRGNDHFSSSTTARGSVGHVAHAATLTQFQTGGLAENENITLAFSGLLIGDWKPTSEELLRAYREQGIGFVNDLQGAWALVIRDGDTFYLARDAAGARTLYFGQQAGEFFFATEPKGVLYVPKFWRQLRPEAVAEYFAFSFIPGARTMLQGLEEVLPGHWLKWSPGEPANQQRYFQFENLEPEEAVEPQSEQEYVDQFARLFETAVRQRIPNLEEPIAVALSGGLDSSIVAAELCRQTREPVHSFALHFGKKYGNELAFAKQVADHCQTVHHEVEILPKHFIGDLRQMVWHLDEPIGDPITMPNYLLAQHVGKEFRYLFNGEGGDPLFGGPKNLQMMLQHWYGGIEQGKNFREKAYLASYRRGYDELKTLLTPEFRKQFEIDEHLESILTPFFETAKPRLYLNKLMAINIRLKGAHLILPKVERMMEAWKLTPLSPLFDQRLIELSYQIPPTLKLAGGVEKVILKRAFENRLPTSIIKRPKSGMRVPVQYWFRGEMKRYARKILSPRAIRREGIFDPTRVKQLLSYNIEEGPGRYGIRLWMLLTFEIWRRIVLEREPV